MTCEGRRYCCQKLRSQGAPTEGSSSVSWDRRAWCRPKKMEFQSIEAVKQCVAAGMGVSVLPSVAVDAELKVGTLAALRWSEPFEVLTQMSWHEARWMSPALRAFLEAAREVFSATTASNR